MLNQASNQISAFSTIEHLRNLVDADFKALNQLIMTSLNSKVPLIGEIGQYIVQGGGKRMRPLLTLLSARACQYQGNQHVQLAVVIEFIHTASLLHDDVVDESIQRRGRKTANAIWGNAASVLVGDFLYSRAFQLMEALENPAVIKVLANTTNLIAEGEVLQLINCKDPSTDEQRYKEVIKAKTAILFAASAELGAIIAARSSEEQKAMADYGLHLGIAFQLIDDLLDYTGDPKILGKNLGDDLAEGKPTLPLIHAMQHANAEEKKLIERAICEGGVTDINKIVQIIHKTKTFDYIKALARQHALFAKQALMKITPNQYVQGLMAMVDFVVERDH